MPPKKSKKGSKKQAKPVEPEPQVEEAPQEVQAPVEEAPAPEQPKEVVEEVKVEAPVEEAPKPVVATPVQQNTAELSWEEKAKLRKLRFGQGIEAKADSLKSVREKVGLDMNISEENEKKRKERIKKFGGVDEDEEAEKRRQRALKFGTALPKDDPEEIRKREERKKKFGLTPDEQEKEKVKARQEKFGIIQGSEPYKKVKL